MIVGVIGHRSWIAGHLIRHLTSRGHTVQLLDKEAPSDGHDFSNLDCLYLFPGRSRPTSDDMEAERELVWQVSMVPRDRQPCRIVCIGSTEPYFTAYGTHKQWVEDTLTSASKRGELCETIVLKTPAVFGPGQPLETRMLVPSLALDGSDLEITHPDLVTNFIYVGDLVAHMAKFADPNYWDMYQAGQGNSYCLIPGTFTVTPQNMRDLYMTWESYR